MRVRVSVGEVDIRVEGVELSVKQIRGLVRLAASVQPGVADEEPEGKAAPVGFTAHLDRLPEEIPQEDLSWYFDERATGGQGRG